MQITDRQKIKINLILFAYLIIHKKKNIFRLIDDFRLINNNQTEKFFDYPIN